MTWRLTVSKCKMFDQRIKYWISESFEGAPILFFLHGLAESEIPSRSSRYGPYAKGLKLEKMTVVQPICPQYRGWEVDACLRFIDEILSITGAKQRNIFLCGACMGAFAVYEIICRRPCFFEAALVAGCTKKCVRGVRVGYEAIDFVNLKKTRTKIWSFHSWLDLRMSTRNAATFVQDASPADIKLTVFRTLGRQKMLKRVFNTKQYYNWLQTHAFQQDGVLRIRAFGLRRPG